jgi:hypothetical protein
MKFIHGNGVLRKTLEDIMKRKNNVIVIQGSNSKMPGGVVEYKEHVKPKRKRKARYCRTKRRVLKNVV